MDASFDPDDEPELDPEPEPEPDPELDPELEPEPDPDPDPEPEPDAFSPPELDPELPLEPGSTIPPTVFEDLPHAEMTAATIRGARATRATRSICIESTVPRDHALGNYPGSSGASCTMPGTPRQSAVQLYGDWLWSPQNLNFAPKMQVWAMHGWPFLHSALCSQSCAVE